IDPGSRVTGYGIVEQAGGRIVRVDHGEIRIKKGEPFTRCLSRIYDELTEVIDRPKPEAVAIEDIFYGKNVKSLIKQGHVRGVALLAASRNGLPVHEYSPLEVKKAVVGYGRAEKQQIQVMVQAILSLGEILPEDASDALAVAICHTHTKKETVL
ncbi:MAG TPA: crossover junction endodeoxyribonuclease RuvC, partial [Syntrophales bacterium]|nr:crossover junction endodeoxyribonuclease RuvC [Syntrophales bacterium]